MGFTLCAMSSRRTAHSAWPAAHSTMTVAFISPADCGRHDTGWGHPEHVGRLRAIPRALRNHPDLFHELLHVEGRHATVSDLALAHDPSYIDRVRAVVDAGGGHLD